MNRLINKIFEYQGVSRALLSLLVMFLFFIFLLFMFWSYYKLVLEKKYEQFVKKYSAPIKLQKYLAGASIYSRDPYPTMICLKSYNLQKPSAIKAQKKAFKQAWNIVDHESAIDILDWLLEEGHREEFNCQFYLNQLHSRKITDTYLFKLVNDARAIEVLDGNNNLRKIDESAIYNCQGIHAWDALRGSNVARICYNVGYLSEDEAWYYLKAFSQQLKLCYSSWEEVAFAFLLGRYLWSDDPNQQHYIEIINERFSHYHRPSEEKHYFNMWQKFPINSL